MEKMLIIFGGAMALAASVPLSAAPAPASSPAPGPAQIPPKLVPDYGRYFEVPDAHQKPDPALRYKVVFDVSQPSRTPGTTHQGIERVARMVNLLNRHGVKMQSGDIVVTIHGPAARTTLTSAAHATRFKGAANPDAELIRQLAAAGVSFRLCGQTMVSAGYTNDELNPDVRVDVAAITTMATLQLQGYAVIQD